MNIAILMIKRYGFVNVVNIMNDTGFKMPAFYAARSHDKMRRIARSQNHDLVVFKTDFHRYVGEKERTILSGFLH